jgi:hypothetical protein
MKTSCYMDSDIPSWTENAHHGLAVSTDLKQNATQVFWIFGCISHKSFSPILINVCKDWFHSTQTCHRWGTEANFSRQGTRTRSLHMVSIQYCNASWWAGPTCKSSTMNKEDVTWLCTLEQAYDKMFTSLIMVQSSFILLGILCNLEQQSCYSHLDAILDHPGSVPEIRHCKSWKCTVCHNSRQ